MGLSQWLFQRRFVAGLGTMAMRVAREEDLSAGRAGAVRAVGESGDPADSHVASFQARARSRMATAAFE
jgi:hypothetical protein